MYNSNTDVFTNVHSSVATEAKQIIIHITT